MQSFVRGKRFDALPTPQHADRVLDIGRGLAGALAAIATQEGIDQAQLVWWIRDHARKRGWAAADLRRWAGKYRELLSLIHSGNKLES